MKIADIRKLSTAELTKKTAEMQAEIAEAKRHLFLGGTQNVKAVRNKRKDLARILTVLGEQLVKEAK